jgi:hypothetical protein
VALADGLELLHDADAVHVAGDQVAAEAVGEAQRLLEVDLARLGQADGAVEGLAGHVEVHAVAARAITVRHTPLLAMLSPSWTSERSRLPTSTVRRTPSSRGDTFWMRPVAATIPENMGWAQGR